MSFNEEFDELARRKLEERAFPYQEADWQDAAARIDALRRRGGRKAWTYGAALLLLISGFTWFALQPAGSETPAVAITKQRVPETPSPAVQAAAATIEPVRSASADHVGDTAQSVTATPSKVESATMPMKATRSAHAAGPTPAMRASQYRSVPQPYKPKLTAHTPEHSKTPSAAKDAASASAGASLQGPGNAVAPAIVIEPSETASVTSDEHAGTVIGRTSPQDGSLTVHEPRSVRNDEVALGQKQPSTNKSELTHTAIEPNSPSATTKAGTTSGAVEQVANDRAANSSTALQLIDPTKSAEAPAEMDSASIANTTLLPPGDTASAVPAAPPATPPIVPERAPWEISVMGGLFTSSTKYTGGNSADWSGGISNERTIGIGAEIMHVGRNIGIGTGLHYGSYAERIRTEAIDRITTDFNPYWYLMTVDTTVLVITDTLPGMPPSYTGSSVDTTLHVLAQGTDTVVSQQHLRDARDQVNRVSYLEVPILLDAHVTQGRWMLGLRGGPTIGLLTGRRGSLPNSTADGYLGFNDVAFREVVFGYTARAYVRYRFNAGWSVGVEPALRGQLLNSIGSGELERRSSALGVMLSLTYRLR